MIQRRWPIWWDWVLEISPHAAKRTVDRRCSEIELREMLGRTRRLVRARSEGRWIAETSHKRRVWYIILKPDPDAESLVVVTAYPGE